MIVTVVRLHHLHQRLVNFGLMVDDLCPDEVVPRLFGVLHGSCKVQLHYVALISEYLHVVLVCVQPNCICHSHISGSTVDLYGKQDASNGKVFNTLGAVFHELIHFISECIPLVSFLMSRCHAEMFVVDCGSPECDVCGCRLGLVLE